MRARTIGVHPLNLQIADVTSPRLVSQALSAAIAEAADACTHCSTDDYALKELRQQNLERLISSHDVFNDAYEILYDVPMASIRLHSLFLLHLNDLINPLLPLISGGGVEPETHVTKGFTSSRTIPSIQSLQCLLSSSLYAVFDEVKATTRKFLNSTRLRLDSDFVCHGLTTALIFKRNYPPPTSLRY